MSINENGLNTALDPAHLNPGRRQIMKGLVGGIVASALPATAWSSAPTTQTTQSSKAKPMGEIVEWSALQLSLAIHARQVSCREVMEAYLARIDQLNPTYNAIVAMRDHPQLLKDADLYDAQLKSGNSMGWLHGIPQAPKDLALTKDIVTSFGSPLLQHNQPKADSIHVARARAAGAIMIGKTNTPEFGLGSQTYNPVYGPTRNPYDPSKTSGGSSGGAATALALRMLPVADGSDFGGSLRNPAAFCNVYGMRPSQGRVPRSPADEVFISQLGYSGPMARTVADLALLLNTQSGVDLSDALSLDTDSRLCALTPATVERSLQSSLAGKKIGWLGDWDGHLAMEPGILPLCETALRNLASKGVLVEPLKSPFPPEQLWDIWLVHRHFGIGNGLMKYYEDPAKRKLLKPEAIWEIEGSLKLSAADFFNASKSRSAWYKTLVTLFDTYDYLAAPTAQVFPFDVNEHWPKEIDGRKMDTYHRWMETCFPWTLSGCPIISVPVGFGPHHLPIGMQLIGRPRDDLGLLKLVYAYEQHNDWVNTIRPNT